MPDAVSLIHLKRDRRRPLTSAEIAWLFAAYADGQVADEQMAALLMAIYLNGLDGAELRAWTGEMIASGERLDLSGLDRPSVDKHSTGGVGDKVSLVLAPLVASCGAAVPMLSGRGLGHTGGTLDKLESIPGWRASLSNDEITAALAFAGAVIAAAGDGLAPADRRLYALRDVTGTVESIPLIASSIMSKKIAEGTRALVLDVKTGRGRLHGRARARPGARPHHGGAGRGARSPHPRPRHRDGHAARPRRRERPRGGGSRRRPVRPGPGRPHGGHPGPGRPHAGPGRDHPRARDRPDRGDRQRARAGHATAG